MTEFVVWCCMFFLSYNDFMTLWLGFQMYDTHFLGHVHHVFNSLRKDTCSCAVAVQTPHFLFNINKTITTLRGQQTFQKQKKWTVSQFQFQTFNFSFSCSFRVHISFSSQPWPRWILPSPALAGPIRSGRPRRVAPGAGARRRRWRSPRCGPTQVGNLSETRKKGWWLGKKKLLVANT